MRGARTFMVKVKAHRGEPLNERADTQAESARKMSSECRQWTTRTQRMTYEWSDSNGVKHVTAWSKTVRKAMLRGGAEYQRQKAMNRAVANWSKTFLNSTNIGLHNIGQAASTGAGWGSNGSGTLGVEMHAPASGGKKLEETGSHDLGS